MIHSSLPILSTSIETAEPSGGWHGTRDQVERGGGRGVGFASALCAVGGRFPQLPDYLAVGFAGYHSRNRPAYALRDRYSGSCPAAVSHGRNRGPASDQAAGAQEPGHAGLYQ